MPGPLPQVADGRLSLFYQGSFKPHRVNLDVAWNGASPTPSSHLNVVAGADITPAAAAAEAATVLKAMFNATTSFGAWIAYFYASGAWIPITSGSLGVTGTNGGADTKAAEGTFTFRDTGYNLDKIVLLEGAFGGLVHQAYAGLGVASLAVVDSVLGIASGDIGRWYRSKADRPIQNFLYYTQSFNKRLRRQEGLG